ncbi:MAG: HPr family phosphocarrier protein [Alphaproteobacteria bacterium]
MTLTARVLIQNRKGLHARAAAKFVKTATQFDAQVRVTRLPKDGESGAPAGSVAATSILGLLMLAAETGVELDLAADGPAAQAALDALTALIARKFDEGE